MNWEAFFTLHRDLPREGPGERGDVAWAAALAGLRPDARICDAGCGPGADIPALLFAAPKARVTGFDLHPYFVEDATARFARNPQVEILRGRLLREGDGLPDPRDLGPFDLIWCAGAIYFTGIEATLAAWREALSPGGVIAFSEPVHLAEPAHPDVDAFFADYPAMTNRAGLAAQIDAAGYECIGTRVLADSAWESYYGPIERRIAELRPGADSALTELLDAEAHEARFWRQHRRDFGYLLSLVRPK